MMRWSATKRANKFAERKSLLLWDTKILGGTQRVISKRGEKREYKTNAGGIRSTPEVMLNTNFGNERRISSLAEGEQQ